MKDKIKFLILGILIGAVITAGVFLVLKKNSSPKFPANGMPDMEQFEGMDFPERKRSSRDSENTTSESTEVPSETPLNTETSAN